MAKRTAVILDKFVAEEPPAQSIHRGRPAIWGQKLEALKGNKGEWMKVATYGDRTKARDAARRLRTGKVKGLTGTFEFASAEVDGKGVLYARYMG